MRVRLSPYHNALKQDFKTNKKMEEQKTIEQLIELVAQQQKVIMSTQTYLEDVHTLTKLQREYIDTLEKQVKYYQLLKQSLWN
jgi:uncharacterized protein with PIN domain